MSDEHKPHDDHGQGHEPAAGSGHDDHAAPAQGHDDHAPAAAPEAHAEEAGHDAPAAAADAHADHGHDAPAAEAAHDDHGHDDHAAAAEAQAAHDDHGQGHDDHAPAADEAHGDHKAPSSEAPAAETSGHDAHPAPVEAAAVAAAGVAAVAATSADKRPVWSDAGDAPFDDVDETPVYARTKKGKKSKGGSSSSEGWEIFKTIAFALLIALVLRVLLFQPFTIPSASMEPNLYEGDYIVVTKWSYGYSRHSIPFSPPIFEGRIFDRAPQRGDIVVFKLPRDNKTDYIKRLIGLPGDRVQMINNVLHINGAPVRDVAVTAEQLTNLYGQQIVQADETLPGGKTFRIQDFGPGGDLDDTPVYEVPAGFYFMMGDNRDNSIDSRVDQSAGVGLVPAENLIGKAEIILFSWSPGASLWNPVSWFSKVRPSRFFTILD